MPKLKSTAEASKITGQSERTIQIHAKRYGIGTLMGGSKGVRQFSDADILKLLAHKQADRRTEATS